MYKVIVTTANGKTSFYKTKRSDDILFGQTGYCFIIRHKKHPVFSQFYYGEKGIITGTETDKRISNLEKQYEKIPVADMVGAKVEYFPMDGRTKRAKSLPWFSVDCLID
jgi:hypothetical protein